MLGSENGKAVLNKLYPKKENLSLSAMAYNALAYENYSNDISKERAAEFEKYISPISDTKS